jgi:hypothetical protein
MFKKFQIEPIISLKLQIDPRFLKKKNQIGPKKFQISPYFSNFKFDSKL